MADCYEPIFDPVIYKAMRLAYEDNPDSSLELRELALSALRNRNASVSPNEGSRPPSAKAISSDAVKSEPKIPDAIEIKEDRIDFDDIPTSSISIGSRKMSAGASMAPFSDGCCVCLRTKDNSPGNKLFECTECHRSYHQNCHSPPIRDKPGCKVDDPRFVFYCCDCVPNLAIEPTYTNRPMASASKTSTTTVTAGWTVNRPVNVAQHSSSKEPTSLPRLSKRRLPSEDD